MESGVCLPTSLYTRKKGWTAMNGGKAKQNTNKHVKKKMYSKV